MTRHTLAGWMLCIVVMLGAGHARAQQPTTEYYDTKKIVTVKGIVRIVLGLPPPAPMVLMVEMTSANGQKAMWVLSGNPMTTLRRDGWQLIGPNAAVKSQEEITVTAWLPHDTQKAVKALAPLLQMPAPGGGTSGPPGFLAEVEAKRAHLAYGLEIIKADGEKLRFGDAP